MRSRRARSSRGISGRSSARPGLTGIGIPEEYGGQGGGIIEQVILDEELSRTLAGLYWLLGITLFDAKAIAPSGPTSRSSASCPRSRPGSMMFAISLTEPGGGTDVARRDADARAQRVDGGWVDQRDEDLVDARARRRPAVPRRAHPNTEVTAGRITG